MSSWIKKEEKLSYVGGKVCIFGLQGTGKSTFAGTFPRINLVDAEDGQTYYLEENENIINVLPTSSASEVQEALEELNDEDVLKEFDSIIIDSGTKLYENMQSAAYEIVEKRAKKQRQKGINIDVDDLNLAQRDWGHIKRWNQQLATMYILMSNLGKWAVVTAHQKDLFDDPNSKTKKKIAEIPDLAKKAEHDFDIVLQTFTKEDKATGEITYHAKVLKDRTKVTRRGDILNNPSFEIWREKWESTKKYGIKEVDMTKDVTKSASIMETEEEQLDEAIVKFKTIMKKLDSANQRIVMKLAKDLEINNPLKTTNLKGIKELLELAKTLQ